MSRLVSLIKSKYSVELNFLKEKMHSNEIKNDNDI